MALMDHLGKIGQAAHDAIQAAKALESEAKSLEELAAQKDAALAEIKRLEERMPGLVSDVAKLENIKDDLERDIAAMKAKWL